MIPTPIPTPESESESSFDSDSGVGIAPGLILMVTGKLHNCLKQPQKKSYAPTDSNIDWREVERSANKQMM